MEIRELRAGQAVFEKQGISIEEIVQHGHRKMHLCSDYLMFIHSLFPMQVVCGEHSQFVPERSVAKVHPCTRIALEIERGGIVYTVKLLYGEARLLSELEKTDFLKNVKSRKERQEWGSVREMGLDYVSPEEENAEHIVKIGNDMLIAPPHSRREGSQGGGWSLMYARGSRAVGIASNTIFSVRDNESSHMHKVMSEIYFCIGGSMAVRLRGKDCTISHGQALLAEPKEVHCITEVLSQPYKGIVIQTPSIPGDKFPAGD